MNILVTDAARARILEIRGVSNKHLRLRISSGGCQGFIKEWELADAANNDDVVISIDDAMLLIDQMSADLLGELMIDYSSGLAGNEFTVSSLAAMSTCGCGASFSI